MTMGYCPQCGAPGKSRERRVNGDDTCENGHKYPSRDSLKAPIGKLVTVDLNTKAVQGPLAICVTDHDRARDFAELLGPVLGPSDQGIIVMPYAASVLGYCGPGTRLFRGIVAISPRPGQSIDRASFDFWIENAIVPYTALNAPRIML